MIKLLLSLFSLSLFLSCNNHREQQGYTLIGNLKNVPDSTKVIMFINDDNKDSTIVLDGKFSFSGKVEEPKRAIIDLLGYDDYTFVWLENTDIELLAEKGKFEEAVITGSQTQKEDDTYMKRMEHVTKVYDRVLPHFNEEDLSEARRDSLLAITGSLRKEKAQITQQFIRDYPNSYMSLRVLHGYKPAWGKEKTQELFAIINPELRETQEGKEIAQFIEVNKDLRLGDQYIDIQLNNVNGQAVKLSEMMGKYTLIEFWASWCGPCRKFNPALVKDYDHFKSRGFEIYAVSVDDDKKSWIEAIKKDKLLWTNVSDLKGKNGDAALIYGVNGIPDNFLIDENGIIIARNLRGETLTKKLKELFAENQIAANK